MPRLTVLRPSRIIILRNLCNAKPRVVRLDPWSRLTKRLLPEGVTDATAYPQGQATRSEGEEGQQGRSPDQSRARPAHRARMAEVAGRLDRDQEGGQSRP